MDYKDIFLQEYIILNKFLYRIKNEHKSTMIYRKLKHLQRLLNPCLCTEKISRIEKCEICCLDLYVLATSNIVMGHYIGYTYIILGMCARFSFLLNKIKVKNESGDSTNSKRNEIDSIFE
ncbi:hypothetical protein COBT_000897 [Conglomerata obtusa]